jgi:hypothetical protein
VAFLTRYCRWTRPDAWIRARRARIPARGWKGWACFYNYYIKKYASLCVFKRAPRGFMKIMVPVRPDLDISYLEGVLNLIDNIK